MRDGDMVLLQDLDAKTAIPGVPQFSNQSPGVLVTAAGRAVIGVDENIGVDCDQEPRPS